MIYYLIAIDIAWLVLRGRWKDMVWANVIVGGIYLPWLPIFLRQASAIQGNFWLSPPTAWDGITVLASVLGVTNNPPKWQVWGMIGLVVVLLAMVVKRREAIALAVVIIVPLAIAYLYSLVRQPIFMERVFVASSAFVPILFAMPVARCSKRCFAISV